MRIDYNLLARTYDITRKENIDTIKRFIRELHLSKQSNVLDFGCGTGNFTCAMKAATGANMFGLDPSDGMRQKAIAKDCDVEFVKGDHACIPFDDQFFHFIYMTDVIHHVPDLTTMFEEFFRVLKPGGRICIVTESHEQLETRYWARYFPATVDVDKKRYPDIPVIIEKAGLVGLTLLRADVTDQQKEQQITPDFLNLVKNKGYSMFRLISDEDYEKGLGAIRRDFENQVIIQYCHGETFLWLQKP